MRTITRLFLSCSLCLLLISNSLAGNTHEYHLKNGLKLIVKEDHRAPVVVSMVWYKVGGAYEPLGLTGISHVLEHMMFKGTNKYGPGVVTRMVAENGGQENAFTSSDYTAYYQELSADKLPLSFKIESDRMHNLSLTEKEYSKEIKVVMEERYMRVDDSPQGLTFERFKAGAFVANPYHNPVIGWQEDLNNLTIQDVRKWYHEYYGPNNATVVVVGDVKPEDVYKLAEKYFGPLKPIDVPALRKVRTPPPLGQRQVDVHAPAKLPWLIMGYNVPVVKSDKEKWQPYALDVLSGILDGGNSARISKDLIREQQIASEAGASYSAFSLYPNLFTLEGTPSRGHTIAQLQQAFFDQIKALQTNLVTPQELERVKAQAIAQKTYDRDSIVNQAMQIGMLESLGLSYKLADEYVENISKVTPQQIQQVAKEYLIPDRLTIGVLHPLPIGAPSPLPQPPKVNGAANHDR